MTQISSSHVFYHEAIRCFEFVTNMATNDNSFDGMNCQLLCPNVETSAAAIGNDDMIVSTALFTRNVCVCVQRQLYD